MLIVGLALEPAMGLEFVGERRPTQGIRRRMASTERNSLRGPPARSESLLDDISLKIIKELQADGRRPFTAIAKNLGLSESVVRQRAQRLIDEGVMQIVAVTDPLRVGLYRQAMVGIRVDGDVREIAAQLAASDEIEYVVICSGAFDLLVELTARDDEHLLDVINGHVRSVPGIRTTETFVYLRLEKQTYNWGA
jgi:Lrp/AsnC family transcriptional regulator for asnA, asnC and gidA